MIAKVKMLLSLTFKKPEFFYIRLKIEPKNNIKFGIPFLLTF